MFFSSPFFLISLLSIPLFLLIFLRKPKRKRIEFSQVFLFLRARREALSRFSRLKFWRSVILILEILFLLFLSFSASTPMGISPPFSANYAVVVLDTSLSMMARDISPDRFSLARTMAGEKIRELFTRGCPVSLWELSSQPRMILDFTTNPHIMENALSQLSPSYAGTEIMELLELLESWASPRVVEVFLFSDLSFSVFPERFSHLAIHQVKIGGKEENLGIVSADLQGDKLWLKIGNFGEREREVHLKVNGEIFPEDSPLWIEGMGMQEISLTLKDSRPYFKVEIDSSDPLPWDNCLFLVPPPNRTVNLVSTSPFLKSALQALNLTVISVSPQDYMPDPRADLAVFEGFLPQTLPETPLLIINPPPDNPYFPWEDVQSQGFPSGGNSPLLNFVDLSSLFFFEVPVINPRGFIPIAFWGDAPFLFQGEIEGNRTVIFSPDLNKTNFPIEPFFPVFLLNAVNFLTGEKPIHEKIFEIEGGELLEPAFKTAIPLGSPPGLYFKVSPTGVRFFSFSFLSEEESNLFKETEIERMGTSYGSPAPRDLSSYFLFLPILLLLLEELLRRKHA
ncbi:MAG: BatA and WFA domain-containing protein [Caldiserica bacterium]|jgi:hypothetical protein|nr:BatA and WFA domain-containing protein [Caldisericota bacterium]MDH7562644.1 BatA and WFA domain-containing protein [Caldisericota bacterium]